MDFRSTPKGPVYDYQWYRVILDEAQIGIVLVHKGLSFSRIDGKSSSKNQQKSLSQFFSQSDCKILLASLIEAGTGLNITCAQIVFIMDPHWNPSQESQAIDRLHRIGQSSIVKVFRFISQDTIEINTQRVQEHKKKLMRSTV
ncbi:hypothetical protein O181_127216, partial [Austropuccinia psidii MF-1]|nr:hypothetical protein [Austropuccinia psidii MF-1]